MSRSKPPQQVKILLIEDSTTLRGILRRSFEKQVPGCEVYEAAEGREAMSSMTRQSVDLIVTDLEMPGMDGPAFLRMLKGNPLLSKKAILVFSSRITPELKVELENLPSIRFLPKSSKPDEILKEAVDLLNANPAFHKSVPLTLRVEEAFPDGNADRAKV